MKHYLVTGGAGFIGSNFVKYLLKKYGDLRITVLDDLTYAGNLGTISDNLKDSRLDFVKANITDQNAVKSVFEKYEIDFVVNFAAESHVDRSIENPQLFLETNILGTQNMLDMAKKSWITGKDSNDYPVYRKGVKFLQVSTDEVYGSLGETGYFTENTPLAPRSPYSASKAAADFIVLAYAETYKLPINITRCSNNYGPYHFPEKLIPLIIKNILEGKKLPVYGDGSNVRDWLFVEDHCKAIDTVLTKGKIGEVYNVGGHNEMKNIDIVKLVISTIRRLMEENTEYRSALKTGIESINDNLISFVKDRPGHDQRYAIDPAKISGELGWTPETCFKDGIVKTIRWYLENQDWVKEVTSGDYREYYDRIYGNR
ncbi:MAG: dTDP-glucose 4,6-dehydratase [Dysgonamonadaceae bacterium]|jgi:dTDP-glucose 4,6-dehydratase|nr:dTDP-glucose 4,6-dehydratase [Dysgonamonadaceae bacterium]